MSTLAGTRVRADRRQPRDVGAQAVERAFDQRREQRGRREHRTAAAPAVRATTRRAARRGEQRHPRHLPSPGMRQVRKRMRVGAIDRREAGGAERAGVDAFRPQRSHKWQRAVDVAVPVDAAADEFVRMLAHQPGFTFAVANLLPPVGACRGAMPMPHERRRREADFQPCA